MDDFKPTIQALQANYAGKISWQVFADQLTLFITPKVLIDLCNTLKAAPFSFEQLIDICGVDYLHYGQSEWETTSTTATGFSRGVSREGDGVVGGTGGTRNGDVVAGDGSTGGAGRDGGDSAGIADEGSDVSGEISARANSSITRDSSKDSSAGSGEITFKPSSRFAVVYHLLSLTNNQRIRLHCNLEGDPPCVPTVTEIWSGADWFEREAFDLFGILFQGHPDLRRILTDYGFIGHPFRKDFPLIGEVEMRYDAKEQRVVYEPVSIESRTLVPKVIREVSD